MVESDRSGRTIDRVLRVLDVLATRRDCTVDDVAASTGIPTSTVYRLLAAIGAHGFAERLAPGLYAAGPAAVQLAEQYRRHALERTAVGTALARLSAETGELAAFMVPLGMETLCVHVAESRHMLRCSFAVGETQPMLRGATAIALLSG